MNKLLLIIFAVNLVNWSVLYVAFKTLRHAESFYRPFAAKELSEGPPCGQYLPGLNNVTKGLHIILYVVANNDLDLAVVSAFFTVQRETGAMFSLLRPLNKPCGSMTVHANEVLLNTDQVSRLYLHRGPFMIVCHDGIVRNKGLVNNLEHIESLVYAI